MASGLISALGLDRLRLPGRVLLVEERFNASSSFVLSCIMWEQAVGCSRTNVSAPGLVSSGTAASGICLVTAHHSFAHYQNVGLKLGYNLATLQQRNLLEVHEVLRLITESLHKSGGDADIDILSPDSNAVLRSLFQTIRKSIQRLSEKTKSVCIVLGNLSDFLTIGMSVPNLLTFVTYLRTLMDENSGLSLVISTHTCSDDDDRNVLMSALAHVADVRVSVQGLSTGLSKDVTGTLELCTKGSSSKLFHYCLMDRMVKVFAPGFSGV